MSQAELMAAQWPEGARVAGRVREQQLLRQAVAGSVQGMPCTVLVHGESGVGKTTLVTAQAEEARAAGHAVLWGRCLRFGAASSPYLPFISALHGWVADGHDAEDLQIEQVSGGGSDGGSPARVLRVIDQALGRLAERSPVLMVVDDLQWADTSSLDALAYLIGGTVRRRLAILVTYRDDGIPEGDALHEWLADMVRMPGVVDVGLSPLTPEETAEQLTGIFGRPAAPNLVTEVWQRSGGNPYLSELLVRGVQPGAVQLPDDLPDALRSALVARWHSLSPRARRLAQVLSVAGRPVSPRILVAVTGGAGVESALREATEAGVTRRDRSGLVWFRHPLLSEVLYGTLLEDEAQQLHRAFVDVLLAQGVRGTRLHGDLALHYVGAEMYDEAFDHCLLAAAEARALATYPEAAVLLRQATELWPDVSDEVRDRGGSLPALLAESATMARTVGDLTGAVQQLEEALSLVDLDADPVTAARVIRLLAQVRWAAGITPSMLIRDVRRAVELSARVPDCEEHALALADLADSEVWRGETESARRHAEEAVTVARRCGSDTALSYALGICAYTRTEADDAEALAREALRLGLEADTHEFAGLAAVSLFNVLESRGRFEDAAEVLVEAHRRGSVAAGLTQLLGVYAAAALLPLGRLEEPRALLRDVLASRPRGVVGIQARECAAVVAVRQGDLDEAQMHLERLRELAEHFEDHVGMHGPGVQAEYLMARGRHREVLDLLERTIEAHARSEPKYGDTLLLWAVRAASALPADRRTAALDKVLAARSRAPVRVFEGEDSDPGQRAVHALFDAELARGQGDPDVVERWRQAVVLADAAGLRYAASDARLRLAESLLHVRERREAAALLREVHATAEQMSAHLLRKEVVNVATSARVELAEPVLPVQPTGNGLTRREREVLAHLVAGRSYSEIAEALFISEKTVSVHVSNLLRKTGTSSRVEAAAWARRSGALTRS